MTRAGAARSAVFSVLTLVCAGFAVGSGGRARAEPALVLLWAEPKTGGASRATPVTSESEPLERDLVARALREPASLDPARIEAVARVDTLLTEADAHAAALREDAALSSLAEAARLCEQLGDVAGAAAWCSEAQRQLGLLAARAGLPELAAAAFRRAVALEPARALLPAEAAPLIVERYEAARAALASAPEGVLRVQASAPFAQVFIDDVARGRAPLALPAPVGRHALRVEAPGHRPWGAFVDVLAGERPTLRIALSPLPSVDAARALVEAAAKRRYAELPALLASLAPLGVTRALVVEVSGVEASSSGRQLRVRCDASRCTGPQRVERGASGRLSGAPLAALDAAALRDARVWLATPGRAAVDEPPAFWARWYVWGAAALVAGAGVALAVALQPEPKRELRVVVEPASAGATP